MSDVTDLIHFRIDEVRVSRCSGEDDGPNLKRLGRAVVTHADTILDALERLTRPADDVVVEVPYTGGKRIKMLAGAPEMAFLARVIFRASFADEEDEAVVVQKYEEWPDDQAKAIRAARYVLTALGGNGAVCAALATIKQTDAVEAAIERCARIAEAIAKKASGEIISCDNYGGPELPARKLWVERRDAAQEIAKAIRGAK